MVQVNYGTNTLNGSAQWRITNGLSAAWAIILGCSVLLMPESPRYAYRMGKIEEARKNMALLNGVDQHCKLIDEQINEIQEKLDAEKAGGEHPWCTFIQSHNPIPRKSDECRNKYTNILQQTKSSPVHAWATEP